MACSAILVAIMGPPVVQGPGGLFFPYIQYKQKQQKCKQ